VSYVVSQGLSVYSLKLGFFVICMDSQLQIATSFLRERFLRVISILEGNPCTAILYDNSKVEATFVTTTGTYDHIAVEDLHTPIGIIPTAIIRTKDIQSLKVEIDIEHV